MLELTEPLCGLVDRTYSRKTRRIGRAAIARGTIICESQSVRVNGDGSRSIEITEEELGFKESLNALERLDGITGYA